MSLQTLQRHEAVLSLWASFQQSCQLPDFQSLVQHNPEDSNPKAERVDGDLEGNFFFFYHLLYFTFVLHNYSIRQIELLKFIYVPYIGSFCFYQYTLNFFMEKRGNMEKWGKSVSGEALMERVYNQTNVIIPMRPV